MSVTKTLTRIARDWAIRCFGIDHVTNLPVRALRLLEETTELAQALDLSREQAHLCVDRVYDRPVGDPKQEIGGVALTFNVLCESMGEDSEALYEAEVRRVLNKPSDHFAKRNQAKIDMGLDAGAQSSDGPFTTECTRPAPHRCAVDGPCNGLVRIAFHGDERVLADRMWRSNETRARFERETNMPALIGDPSLDSVAAGAYGEKFNRWALIELRRRVPPPGAQS